jgi:hypothetical protein
MSDDEYYPGHGGYMETSQPAPSTSIWDLLNVGTDKHLAELSGREYSPLSATARLVGAYGLLALGQPFTVQLLADELGLHRNTVSRALAELTSAGWAVKGSYTSTKGLPRPWWLFRDPGEHLRGLEI